MKRDKFVHGLEKNQVSSIEKKGLNESLFFRVNQLNIKV